MPIEHVVTRAKLLFYPDHVQAYADFILVLQRVFTGTCGNLQCFKYSDDVSEQECPLKLLSSINECFKVNQIDYNHTIKPYIQQTDSRAELRHTEDNP